MVSLHLTHENFLRSFPCRCRSRWIGHRLRDQTRRYLLRETRRLLHGQGLLLSEGQLRIQGWLWRFDPEEEQQLN